MKNKSKRLKLFILSILNPEFYIPNSANVGKVFGSKWNWSTAIEKKINWNVTD